MELADWNGFIKIEIVMIIVNMMKVRVIWTTAPSLPQND